MSKDDLRLPFSDEWDNEMWVIWRVFGNGDPAGDWTCDYDKAYEILRGLFGRLEKAREMAVK